MVNTKFEAYKIKRELKRSGVAYEFTRSGKNQFGEPDEKISVTIGTVTGLYHEQNGSIQVTTGETTQTRTKKTPTILCLWEDTTSLGLSLGDKTIINGKVFRVTGIVNIQEWNIIGDVSLEVVDDGN